MKLRLAKLELGLGSACQYINVQEYTIQDETVKYSNVLEYAGIYYAGIYRSSPTGKYMIIQDYTELYIQENTGLHRNPQN